MKKNKYVVWLDVDDVLLCFKQMYNKHLRLNYKINIDDNFMPQSWLYEEVLPEGLKFDDTMSTLPTLWAGLLSPMKGASDFTHKLRKKGVKVILITHVFGHQGPERIKCLNKNKIHFDEIYFTMGRTKSDFSKEVVKRYPTHKHIFLDDKAENAVDFLNNMRNVEKVFTLDLPFNQDAIARYKKTKKKNLLDSNNSTSPEMFKKALKLIK